MDNSNFLKPYVITIGIVSLILLFGLFVFFWQNNAENKGVINGIFSFQGTVPQNSSITLLARDISSETQFTPVSSNILPNGLTAWSFSGKPGRTYAVKALLAANGKNFDSNTIVVNAPFFNQVLTFSLNSSPSTKAVTPTSLSVLTNTPMPLPTKTPTPASKVPMATPKPPTITITPIASSSAQAASMSGTIQFTGQAPLSSRIVIFQRVTGTQTYSTAIDNIIPYNTSIWIWNGGTAGVSYDLIAILKQKQSDGTDLDLVSSGQITVSAPSTAGVFALAYAPTLSAPGPNISVTCNSLNNSSQTWSASVSFLTVQGARSYWFKIGTTDGGTDLTNSTQNAINSSSQSLSLPFKNGTLYYAKYAYSGVSDILSGNGQFSPLSSSAQLKCQ